jgi:hypothetical protein
MLKTVNQWPPDYVAIFSWRQKQLLKLRKDENLKLGAIEYYKTRPNEFINHWVMTYDPRLAMGGLPPRLPFVLFKRQQEFIRFLHELLLAEQNGLVEKSRDMGATWLCCAFSVWLWRFWPGSSVGWGSRKAELVDKIGDPDSIFQKLRIIIRNLPQEFWPLDFDPKAHMTEMKIVNPETEATITGEGGDSIGRGGRKLIYFVDESAHLEHAESIAGSLGDNTRIQVDISSVKPNTLFQRRREAGIDWSPGQKIVRGKTNVFVMDWRDHPEKTQVWYDERKQKWIDDGLSHIFAQEVDRDYFASVDNVVIPGEWIRAAIDAHLKLGFDDSGGWSVALDVADEGGDTNCCTKRKGVVLKSAREWGERDVGVTTRRTVDECRGLGMVRVQYDCIGIGASVKAEYNRLCDDRETKEVMKFIHFIAWNAGAAVQDPERRVVENDRQSPMNEDFFDNLKAQGWWSLRRRFEKTFRALQDLNSDKLSNLKYKPNPAELISISSEIKNLPKLIKELSQPTMTQGSRLKMVIEKKPDGAKSPNIGDSVMMNYFPIKIGELFDIPDSLLIRSRMPA